MSQKIPTIIAVEGEEKIERFIPLLESQTTIGRDETNYIAIKNTDSKASRFHACIIRKGKNFILHDLKSTNGTWINNRQVLEQVNMKNGDVIRIGGTQLRFDIRGDREQIVNNILQNLPIFSKSKPQTLLELSKGAKFEHYDSKLAISIENLSRSFYIVVSGKLNVSMPHKDNLDKANYMRGDFIDGLHLVKSLLVPQINTDKSIWLLVLSRDKLAQLIVPFLHKLPFGKLPEDRLIAIANKMFIKNYKKGHILFNQNDYADALYIVVAGEVAMIKRPTQDGHEDEIFSYNRGSLFGELGLLVDKPRATGGLIKEESVLLVLPRDQFESLAEEYPEIALSLYHHIAGLLEKQSENYWRAAKDIEIMQELVQSTKMNALGQLVAGIAHEINTPVGSISSNSYQLGGLLTKTETYIENLSSTILGLAESGNALQQAAVAEGYPLDSKTIQLVTLYTQNLVDEMSNDFEKQENEYRVEEMLEISEELGEASKRIKIIVKNLANFARLDEAERKTVDIHEGIDATLSLLHHELKYQVDVEINYGHLPQITCHPNELNQVYMNLLMNAIQAMDLNKLRLEKKRGLIRIKTYQDGEWGIVAISDNGKGISPENMSRIFEPFFSTKGAAAAAGGLGLGMGLAISKKIIEEKHGGRIKVKSKLEEGTTFSIWIPLDKNELSLSTQTMTFEKLF